MTNVTIIGNGNMGTAIGGLAANGGATVRYVGRGEVTAGASLDEIVVLAVPYGEIDGIISAYGPALDGKIVVDISNPLDFSTFDSLVVPVGSSATAEIQSKIPEARVLKAFNTTFAGTLSSRSVGDNPTTVLIAGDDIAAKDLLKSVVIAGGLAAIDAGSLARAHELEALGFLQLTLAAVEKVGWTGGFAVVR
jgi:hypothetical protein